MNSFYSREELSQFKFRSIGENVLLSRKSSIYSPEKISIGSNVRIDDFSILSGNITIGSFVHISAYVALYGSYGIEINDYSGISAKTIVYSAVDDFSGEYMIGPMLDNEVTNVNGGKVVLEKYTQIGAACVVMPSVTIKEGSVVGAMSFVNKSTEKWSIFAGTPIRFIKERKKELLKYIDINKC